MNYKKVVPAAIIYTMNCPNSYMEKVSYPTILGTATDAFKRVFGMCEEMYSCNTLQFSDYEKHDCNIFNAEEKKLHHEKQFPIDMKNAFQAGVSMVEFFQDTKIRRWYERGKAA